MLYMIIYVISNLYISPLIFHQQIFSVSPDWLLILKIIGQCDMKHTIDVSDKNNNIRFEGLNIHRYYHSLSYHTLCDTSSNVCPDLQNCSYSLYVFILAVCTTFYKCSFIITSSIIMYCLKKSYYFLYILNTMLKTIA